MVADTLALKRNADHRHGFRATRARIVGGGGAIPSTAKVEPDHPWRRLSPSSARALDFVSDTLYRDTVEGHHLGWINVTLQGQPKIKDSASSALRGDIS
jgi:hypothetical protein